MMENRECSPLRFRFAEPGSKESGWLATYVGRLPRGVGGSSDPAPSQLAWELALWLAPGSFRASQPLMGNSRGVTHQWVHRLWNGNSTHGGPGALSGLQD